MRTAQCANEPQLIRKRQHQWNGRIVNRVTARFIFQSVSLIKSRIVTGRNVSLKIRLYGRCRYNLAQTWAAQATVIADESCLGVVKCVQLQHLISLCSRVHFLGKTKCACVHNKSFDAHWRKVRQVKFGTCWNPRHPAEILVRPRLHFRECLEATPNRIQSRINGRVWGADTDNIANVSYFYSKR